MESWNYSETSNNGLSERQTTSVQWTNSMSPIALPIEIVHSNVQVADTSQETFACLSQQFNDAKIGVVINFAHRFCLWPPQPSTCSYAYVM